MTPSLFSRKARLAVLGSGSKGNASYIGDGHAGVLVDCGLSARQILARLEAVGLRDAPIDAVLVTHEHSDHVGAAAILSRRLRQRYGRGVPFFMTAGTRDGLGAGVVPEGIEVVRAGEEFGIRHLAVEPFSVPHDTRDPVAWRVGVGGRWLGVVTDLGRPTTLVVERLRTLSAAVVEFNHDLDMLLAGPYPWPIKQRVRSAHGHLSNDQAADLLGEALGPVLRHVVLGHLSEENNRPGLALARAARVLAERGVTDEIRVGVAAQAEPTPVVEVEVDRW